MKLINSNEINRKADGYLTVFLALSMTIIFSLCLVLIEGARQNGARLMSECVLDIGMNSILAEYHRELLNQYDLFYIDTSYGSGTPSYYNTVDHLRNYMEHNFSLEDLNLHTWARDLFSLSVQNLKIEGTSLATDRAGLGYRQQAVEAMYYNKTLGLYEKVEEWVYGVESNGLSGSGYTAKRESVESAISSIHGSKQQISEEEWVTVEVDNPADVINAKRNLGVLLLALDDSSQVSNKGIVLDGVVSKRELNQGNLVLDRNKEESSVDLLLFNEYLLEYFSNYLSLEEKSSLEYEIEYILAGESNDIDNLKNIVSKILAIREGANFLYLYNNPAKRIQVASLAATVSAVFLVPALQTLLEYSILFAWSFGESVQDVKALLKGGKVPLMKQDSSWCTSLSGIMSGNISEGGNNQEGLSYQDYLRIFLAMTPTNTKTMRSLDMIELSIRGTKGNEKFRIDGCLDGLEIEANIVSEFGSAFVMKRKCSYWE